MALGLVSPLLNRGVRSRWLASLPGAGSKMLVIDSNGDTSFQDIPVAAWGSITGTLSAQTDLQNALNAKLSLTGGTLTGGLNGTTGTFSGVIKGSRFNTGPYEDTTAAFSTYHTGGHYFAGASNLYTGQVIWKFRTGPGYILLNDAGNGCSIISEGANAFGGEFSVASGAGAIPPQLYNYKFGFRYSDAYLAIPLALGRQGTSATASNTHEGAWLWGEASDTFAQRRSTNAQRFNLYGTYTDANNYRRLYLSSTTAGAFTIGVEGAGTGASGNTLTILNSAVQIGGAINGLYVQNNGNTQFWVGNNISFSIGGGNGKALSVGGSLSGDPTNESCAIGWSAGHVAGSISVGFRYGGATQVNLQGTHAGAFQDLALRRLIFEGNTSSFPMLKRNGTALNFRLADDSADAPITAGAFTITQPVSTSGSPTAFTLTGAAHTTLAASTEATDVNFNLARTVQFAAGALTTQRAFRIQAPTYSFASASTITDASTLSISGSPVAGTNATITNRYSLLSESGTVGIFNSSGYILTIGSNINQPWHALRFLDRTILFGDAGNGAYITSASQNASPGNLAFAYTTTVGGSNVVAGLTYRGWVFTNNYGGGGKPVWFGASAIEAPSGVSIFIPASNIWEQRESTNSQTFRLYNTYTDASNYIRQSLSFTTYSTTVHAQLAAEGAGTGAVNVPFVITPRGTGAFILGPMPDGTTTGGNARGARAVDLQTLRSAASEVASGESSFVAGRANTASNFRSVALGFGNSVSQTNGFAAGNSNTVSGGIVENGIALGAFNTASSGSAVAVGYANLASGSRAFATGDSTQSTAFCTSTFGHRSVADRYAMTAFSAGWFSANGDAQKVGFVARAKTTNNTATTLFLDGSTTRLTIPSGKLFLFTAKIVGVKSDGTSRACYVRKGAIINIAGTTSLVGTIDTVGTDVEDNAATDVAITADNTNDALDISVTGITSETWRWVAVVEGVEVAYGT